MGSEADKEVASVVYPGGGRDGRGAEILPDYNAVEGMDAAVPHLTMRWWRSSACGVGLTWLLVVVRPAAALCGVILGCVAFGVVMPLLVVCPRWWGSKRRWGPYAQWCGSWRRCGPKRRLRQMLSCVDNKMPWGSGGAPLVCWCSSRRVGAAFGGSVALGDTLCSSGALGAHRGKGVSTNLD